MSLAKLLQLKGKVALVTGGSHGLGLQMAEVLGELGAKVAITARKQHELDAAAKHLKSLGIEALPVVCEMGELQAITPRVDAVLESSGRSTSSSTTLVRRGARRRSRIRSTAGTR